MNSSKVITVLNAIKSFEDKISSKTDFLQFRVRLQSGNFDRAGMVSYDVLTLDEEDVEYLKQKYLKLAEKELNSNIEMTKKMYSDAIESLTSREA